MMLLWRIGFVSLRRFSLGNRVNVSTIDEKQKKKKKTTNNFRFFFFFLYLSWLQIRRNSQRHWKFHWLARQRQQFARQLNNNANVCRAKKRQQKNKNKKQKKKDVDRTACVHTGGRRENVLDELAIDRRALVVAAVCEARLRFFADAELP
jgi:hypothetical protein